MLAADPPEGTVVAEHSHPGERASEFDPYHRWLAIPRGQRPPTYYQLLGVAADEADPEVIEEAALRQTSHVRTYQTGPYGQQATAVLNELGQARATLLNPEKRKEYDARLPRPPAPPPPPPLVDVELVAEAPDRGSARRPSGGVVGPAVCFACMLCLGAGLAFGLALERRGATPAAQKKDAGAGPPAAGGEGGP